MWTRDFSESGRGVWGCVPNLFFFFFFPSKSAVDVATDPVDVSVASCKSKLWRTNLFRARAVCVQPISDTIVSILFSKVYYKSKQWRNFFFVHVLFVYSLFPIQKSLQ